MSSSSPAHNSGQHVSTDGHQPVSTQPTVPSLSATDFATRSQSSSFDESMIGANSSSEHLPEKIVQSSRNQPHLEDNTPSTSFSYPSSQEHLSGDLQDQFYQSSFPLIGDISSLPPPVSLNEKNSNPPDAFPVALENGRNVPSKRMANGDVKYIGLSLPDSPINVDTCTHSRDTSVIFKGSPIGELSDQLRTRLSYAMVKVQNGWQTRSLEELESLPQHGSPNPKFAEVQNLDVSPPKATKPRLRRHESTNSSNHSIAVVESIEKVTNTINDVYGLKKSPLEPNGDASSPQVRQADRTYESFWREHSTTSTLKHVQTQDRSLGGPSLAPSVDILPRSRRRPQSLRTQPGLAMENHVKSPVEHIANSNLVISSATPENRSSVRTASQNAAMEKDAVETLLFMSSPGNSSHYPSARTTGTPSRSSFALPEKRVGFAATIGSDDLSDQDLPPTHIYRNSKGLFDAKRVVSEADIDKLLDEMPDEDSSSEDED